MQKAAKVSEPKENVPWRAPVNANGLEVGPELVDGALGADGEEERGFDVRDGGQSIRTSCAAIYQVIKIKLYLESTSPRNRSLVLRLEDLFASRLGLALNNSKREGEIQGTWGGHWDQHWLKRPAWLVLHHLILEPCEECPGLNLVEILRRESRDESLSIEDLGGPEQASRSIPESRWLAYEWTAAGASAVEPRRRQPLVLKLPSPVGFFMGTEALEAQSLEGSVDWINNVILVSLSPDVFEAAVAEFLGYDVEFGSALLGDFGIDNALDSGLDVIRWLSVHVDLGGRKILVAVDGSGVRRALGSLCPRFRWGYGTP
ncbi:hypothetical protein PMIN01_13376 [Paraphaeosphaeria minitans]|uniref:Uncharacterized protein n=1 Tax=Paraphaeosphaeria minitans TaxID=565426 RepID=A0A9P6G4W2_9PLEO|nr:hypothetical protein PMIN01_13376 [Paraphaeosphaeria minitans]